MERQTQDTSPAIGRKRIARKRTLRRYYLKHCKDILQKQMTGRSMFLEDQELRQACLADPRNIRDVAGEDVIVCPGTKNHPCWRLVKLISGAHLRQHFIYGKHPTDVFKDHWGLPRGFPLTSQTYSTKMEESRKGTRPPIDPAVVRPLANEANRRRGGKLNRLALRSLREADHEPATKAKMKISDDQIKQAYAEGLTAQEAGTKFHVSHYPFCGRRARKLGLDRGAYQRNKKIVSKLLADIRYYYLAAGIVPTAHQITGRCGSRLRKGDARIQFLSAIEKDLTPAAITALINGNGNSDVAGENIFPLTAQILRTTRLQLATTKPGKRGPKAKIDWARADSLEKQGDSLSTIARKVNLKAYKKDPRRAANAVWIGLERFRSKLPT